MKSKYWDKFDKERRSLILRYRVTRIPCMRMYVCNYSRHTYASLRNLLYKGTKERNRRKGKTNHLIDYFIYI